MTDSIELIVVDLDGTLLDAQHEMTERVVSALKAAHAKGVRVMLATGKTRRSALHIIDRLELNTPGIFVQGLVTHAADGSLLHQVTLDPSIVRQALTFAEDRGFSMIAYSGTQTYVRARDHNTNLVVEYGEPEPEVVGPLQNILDSTPINKLAAIYRPDPRKVKALRWQLSMQINGSGRLVQPAVPEMLELLPPGGSKGSALKTLLSQLKIAPARMMAVGDGENDLEMLQMAGLGVAVANAESMVKDIADYVTTASYGDGVAEAIERFVLNPEPAKAETETATDDKSETPPNDLEEHEVETQ